MRTFSLIAKGLLALAIIPAALHAQDPDVISPAELREAGQASLRRQVDEYGVDSNPRWRRDVKLVIDSLKRAANYRQHPLTWEIVSDSNLNAMAAPGGIMIINVGLPLFCESLSRAGNASSSAAQRKYFGCLSAVIGHEFGHLALGHTDSLASMIRRRRDIARRQNQAASVAAAVGDTLLMRGLRKERQQELDADRAGALYALRAGWEVQDAIDLFVAMDSMSRGSGRRQLTWLEGHPRASERAALLESHRAQLKLLQRDLDDALALIETDVLPDSAAALLDRVLAAFPNMPAARHAKAVLLGKRWLDATPVANLRVRPSLNVYDARFFTTLRAGDDNSLQRAREAFEQALRVSAHPYTLSGLAVLDAYAGRDASALERARKAVELMPEDGDMHNNLGVVHFVAGRFRDALASFATAERVAGDDLTPAIAFNHARGAMMAGDSVLGRRLLDRYLSFDRRSGWGREAARLASQLGGGPTVASAGADRDDAPAAGSVRLRSRSAEVTRSLGEPEEGGRTSQGMLWRYPSRGIAILFDDESRVQAVALVTESAGDVLGVRVGSSGIAMLRALGNPVERARQGATAEAFAFDRGTWAIIVTTDGGVVDMVSIRTVTR